MKKRHFNALAVAICCAIGTPVMAQNMSNADFKMGKERISTEYKTVKSACTTHSGNAKDICVVEANGTEQVPRAELEAAFEPSVTPLPGAHRQGRFSLDAGQDPLQQVIVL